jgi:hypothetical protein
MGCAGGVGDDLPVEHFDLPGAVGGDAPVVGNEHDGHSVGVEVGQQGQHVVAGGRVEVAGGLVGQHDRRVAGQRPGDRHPLPLPPDSWVGRARSASTPPRRSPSISASIIAVAGTPVMLLATEPSLTPADSSALPSPWI